MHRWYNDLASLWPIVSPASHYEEEVATFRAQLLAHGVAVGASILHLGCGGGSVDFNLKQHYRVTGIDISDAMLKQARSLNPDVAYINGDMRDARIGELFDAVLVHDAISYMTSIADLQRAYVTAAAHVRSGGILIALPEEIRGRFDTHREQISAEVDGDTIATLVEIDYDADPSDNEFETTYIFVVRRGAEVQIETDRHIHGIFELHEFVDAIEVAGFDASVEKWDLSDWEDGEEPLPLIVGIQRGDSA